MKIFSLLILFGLVIFFSSCRYQRQVTDNYLQDVRDTVGKDPQAFPETVIQKGDLLSIRVFSSANGIRPDADAPYNLNEPGTSGSGGGSAGYLVNENGDIEYPQLGVLHVEGLTRNQLTDMMKKKLEGSQLTQASVIVRFLNYRVTVLGEVKTPNTFTIPTERITILEALGLAGDVTEYGRRDNVKVIRENNGQREIGTLDLSSKNMFTSPYYHLQQNDVVLVEQSNRRRKQQEQQTVGQQIGIATSIVTAIALILNLIKK